MVYAPQSQSGSFFNDQEREVASQQWVEALSLSRDWRGQHVIKIGMDTQRSRFTGFSASRPVEIRRLDGSRAERIEFGKRTEQQVAGVEFAVFVQDRWRIGSRATFELGLRADRDPIVERVNWSPRAGVAIGVAPEGRAILRGGFGKFVQRTPLNVEAFPVIRGADDLTLRARRHAVGAFHRLCQCPRLGPADPRGLCRQCRVEPAFRPASPLQAGVHAASRLPRVDPVARFGGRRTAAVERGDVALQGTGGDDTVSGRGAAGHHRLLRLGEGDGRSQQLRSVLRQPSEPDRPRQRAQLDSHRRSPSADPARHASGCPTNGTSPRCWSSDRGSRGRRWTSSRTSWVHAAEPGACLPFAPWISRSRGRGSSRSTASAPASSFTTSSGRRPSGTCRTTSRRPTTDGSSIPSSAPSGSCSAQRDNVTGSRARTCRRAEAARPTARAALPRGSGGRPYRFPPATGPGAAAQRRKTADAEADGGR